MKVAVIALNGLVDNVPHKTVMLSTHHNGSSAALSYNFPSWSQRISELAEILKTVLPNLSFYG